MVPLDCRVAPTAHIMAIITHWNLFERHNGRKKNSQHEEKERKKDRTKTVHNTHTDTHVTSLS